MRRAIEVAFELRTGGLPLIPWLFQRHNSGRSLREVAADLSELVGVPVSHESVRRWMLEG